MTQKQRAFSLIELVLVMLIIGILAVSVAPRFFSQSDISHVTTRDRIIAQLRLVQLQAMNQINVCNRIRFTSTQVGIEQNAGAACGGALNPQSLIDVSSINVTSDSQQAFTLQFDGQGRVIPGASGEFNSIQIKVSGAEAVDIKIEAQGYIHAL